MAAKKKAKKPTQKALEAEAARLRAREARLEQEQEALRERRKRHEALVAERNDEHRKREADLRERERAADRRERDAEVGAAVRVLGRALAEGAFDSDGQGGFPFGRLFAWGPRGGW